MNAEDILDDAAMQVAPTLSALQKEAQHFELPNTSARPMHAAALVVGRWSLHASLTPILVTDFYRKESK